jgi:hypothetical protein
MVRLLGTEAIRVYADRLIDLVDYHKAKDICITSTIKHFEGLLDSQVLRDEKMFCAFPPNGDDASFEENGSAPMVTHELVKKRMTARSPMYLINVQTDVNFWTIVLARMWSEGKTRIFKE